MWVPTYNTWLSTQLSGCPQQSRGSPIQTPGSPQRNVWMSKTATSWESTQKCGHPINRVDPHKTSWTPITIRGHPKLCGGPPQNVWEATPAHQPKAWSSTARLWRPTKSNTWLHVEHRVGIQVLETWESVRNNVDTHITSVWLSTTCWVGVQNRGSVWEQVVIHVCPVWRCLDEAWVPSVDAVGERIIGIHVTCPHTGPCGHSMACYNYARPSLPISIKPSLLPLGESFFNKKFFAKSLCINLLRNTFAMFSV